MKNTQRYTPPMAPALPDLAPPDDLAQEIAWLTKPQLDWLIRTRSENGLDRATYKVGRRILISRSKFYDWLISNPEVQNVA